MSTPKKSIPNSILLAELLRVQRWAGGDSVSAARIFGLMHGFESVINEEKDSFGISEIVENKVEDILDELDSETLAFERNSIKDRLRIEGISESDATRVMELCRLQSRYTDVVDRIAKECGFRIQSQLPEHNWFGSLHYIELVDSTEDAHKKLHAVFSPTVPRIGELIQPENGPPMKVVKVEYVMCKQGEIEGVPTIALVPYVYLETDE